MSAPGAPFAIRLSAFAAAALLCAVVSNALAGPGRRLAWLGAPPAPPSDAPRPAPLPPPPLPEVPPAPAAPEPRANPPKASQAPAPAGDARFKPDPDAVIREIDSRDAWAAYGLHLPFLDARRSAEFAEGHVPGAWSVPVWEDGWDAAFTLFESRKAPRPKDPIVIYCAGGGCEDSRLLAGKLVGLGYRNLLIYAGGMPDWTERSRPVETGGRR